MALQESFETSGNSLFRYRSYLPLLLLSSGLCVRYFQSPLSDFESLLVNSLCLIFGFLGLGVRIATVGFTPKNTSGRNTESQVADSLNTTGIYSTVRHPLYLGNFLMWLGAAVLSGHGWFVLVFCLAYWLYYERIMYAEEQFLRKKFGEEYLSWANRTNSFIPGLKNRRPADMNFSWRKVLKKEKNGLAAIFIVLFLFDLADGVALCRCPLVAWNWITISTIASIVVYLFLRFLKRNTELLNEEGR